MTRKACIELPQEGGEDKVGLLLMSVNGTRDAAANFQRGEEVYDEEHQNLDFVWSGYQEGLELNKTFKVSKEVVGARENEQEEGEGPQSYLPFELFWIGVRGWSKDTRRSSARR